MNDNIKKVIIYVIEGCPFCASALRWLDEQLVDYEKIVVPGDKNERSELDQFAKYFPDDPRGVPIIVVETKDGQKHYFNDESDSLLQELILNE